MRRAVAAGLLAAAIALGAPGPSAAGASPKKRIAVLDLVTEGMSRDVHAQFEATIEEQLRKLGYEVVSHTATVEAISKRDDLFDGCTFGPCVKAIGRALGVERLLDVRAAAEGASYTFVVSMVGAADGAPLAQVVTNCGVCTVVEALGKMGASVTALEGQALPMRVPDTGPIVTVQRERRSKLLPILLTVGGLAIAGSGAAIVTQTDTKDPGWVSIGGGGTMFLTGLVMLIAGD